MPCRLVNPDGMLTLVRILIDINIRKRSEVAKRPVPLRVLGERVDTDAYMGRVMTLELEARLTYAEKTTLETIFGYTGGVSSITLNDWRFDGWFRQRRIFYDHIHEPNRPWRTVFTFDITSWCYDPSGACGEHFPWELPAELE